VSFAGLDLAHAGRKEPHSGLRSLSADAATIGAISFPAIIINKVVDRTEPFPPSEALNPKLPSIESALYAALPRFRSESWKSQGGRLACKLTK
jgi:hypothetical protein